jgi:protoporphyrinogen oxidase
MSSVWTVQTSQCINKQESDVDIGVEIKASELEKKIDALFIGGGPAGLTGAMHLQKIAPDRVALVVEAGERVGGIARTEEHLGYRFDIGGHRFFTKVPEVKEIWDDLMGTDFIDVSRSSRIYYRGRFFDYPLRIGNALSNLGIQESVRSGLSWMKWQISPSREEVNFEQWVCNRFGGRLYWHFFRTYTQKVWGIPGTEIQADWAAQRIKDLSLFKAVVDSVFRRGESTSLIKSFKYPRLGPGQLWERAAARIESNGGEVRLRTSVGELRHDGSKILEVDIQSKDGSRETIKPQVVLSTMPLTQLVRSMKPEAPPEVLKACDELLYRDFLIVTLILDHADPFPDNWIYIHEPNVKVGRIQNFRAWSRDMVPNETTASIGMEYFCHEGDGLWAMDDQSLIELGSTELERLGLAPAESVCGGTVIRQPKAYPVYDAGYQDRVETIRRWLEGFENLQTAGRNAMHRYNNQDHSMLAAMAAVRRLLDPRSEVDPWEVNVERSYQEEFRVRPPGVDVGSNV